MREYTRKRKAQDPETVDLNQEKNKERFLVAEYATGLETNWYRLDRELEGSRKKGT